MCVTYNGCGSHNTFGTSNCYKYDGRVARAWTRIPFEVMGSAVRSGFSFHAKDEAGLVEIDVVDM